MPPKLRRVPQFLKEIPLGGGSQGDYANEWGYAQYPSGGAGEDWNYAHYGENYNSLVYKYGRDQGWKYATNVNSNYLGWWSRNGRAVYYFGDNRRTYDTRAEWEKYDWYYDEAERINRAIDKFNENVDDFNRGRLDSKEFTNKVLYFPKIILRPPKEPQHTLGIQRWLQERKNDYDNAVKNFYTELEQKQTSAEREKEKRRLQAERETQARLKAERERQAKLKAEQEERQAKLKAEQEAQAKIKAEQEELKRKREESVVKTFDKRINLLEKAIDKLGEQKLDFDKFTVSNMSELDGIRRDLREVDAQFDQRQKRTDEDVFRLSNEIGELFNNSTNNAKRVDDLNKTVQISTGTVSNLEKKYDLLKKYIKNVDVDASVRSHYFDNSLGEMKKSVSGIKQDLTAIQERNEKIDKDYIDGISVFKEQQKQLSKEVAATKKDVKNVKADQLMTEEHIRQFDKKIEKDKEDTDGQFRALRRDLIEVKGKNAARVKYDAYVNNAAKRRTGTVYKNHVRARQYDAARDILKSYLSTVFEQYAVS